MGCGKSSGAGSPPPDPPVAPVGGKADEAVRPAKQVDQEFGRQLTEMGIIMGKLKVGKDTVYISILSAADKSAVEVAAHCSGNTHSGRFDEPSMTSKRDTLKLQWAALFKSIQGAVKRNKVTIKESQFRDRMMTLLLPMEPQGRLQFELNPIRDPLVFHTAFLDPLVNFCAKRKGPDDAPFTKLEVDANTLRGSITDHEEKATRFQEEVNSLTSSAKQAHDDERAAKDLVDGVTKDIRRLKNPKKVSDLLYPASPPCYVLHTQHATEHIPQMMPCNHTLLGVIREKHGVTRACPADADTANIEELSTLLAKTDDWDYDVFAVENMSNGRALFITTYALLYQHGLVQHFNIDEDTLCNFLQAIESGYHPNAYHNSTHAADVLQISHYILEKGGLKRTIGLSKEDTLACLLASAIHDYDHPGLNNNFHIRTKSYLATLYNDRSVLENHHLAQVFDIMKNPKYDIFQTLTYEQRKDVRDTMTEMVLSTDMGQHAKIFQTFRRRLGEDQEWSKREDQRLALSITIKMADISNCCRPAHLYQEWAKRIAEEFYEQGDAESKLGFTISPFMDRRKNKVDFPKGQVSFMNYIVIPLFEAGAQMMPDLAFTVKEANVNKEMWKRNEL